jgi:GT2 family glycosyltransferase
MLQGPRRPGCQLGRLNWADGLSKLALLPGAEGTICPFPATSAGYTAEPVARQKELPVPALTTAVVVCAYTLERWDDIVAALRSAAEQTPAPDELWLVVDHNPALLERAEAELTPVLPELRIIGNQRKKGLSGARNTAVEHVGADVVVFLDDDAAASEGWLGRLLAPYEDESVIAVGGAATPRWPVNRERPVTLPRGADSNRGELDWVVGCTYRGQPETAQPVRNLMGCNMSMRREVFARVGGFSEELGRVGKTPLGCEETEFCIRARRAYPDGLIVFVPEALVSHHVSPDRLSWSYLRRRCFAEGVSKAAVSALVGQEAALATERTYARQVLPRAVLRQLRAGVGTTSSHRLGEVAGAGAVLLGLASTVVGFLRGRAGARGLSGTPVAALNLSSGASRGEVRGRGAA